MFKILVVSGLLVVSRDVLLGPHRATYRSNRLQDMIMKHKDGFRRSKFGIFKMLVNGGKAGLQARLNFQKSIEHSL